MILDLHRQGLSPTAIARQLGIDRKTVRKYIARGMDDPPNYRAQPRRPRRTDDFLPYLRERLAADPGLSAVRLLRELRERGFGGGYTAVKRAVQDIRPDRERRFEVRFETPPGEQAQVDFARFEVVFADEPSTRRIVWLFSMVLGFSRLIWARFVVHQDLQSVLRCHVAAFTAIGGAPREILYDRMKTAVIGEDADGLIIDNRSLIAIWRVISASTPKPADRIGPRRRAKSSARFATSARTFTWQEACGISMTSTPSCVTGSTPWPTRAPTPPPSAWSARRLLKSRPRGANCRCCHTVRC